MNHSFEIATSNRDTLSKHIDNGSILFVVGANGTGKSSLMQKICSQNRDKAKRILANRQIWFEDTLNITASQKRQNEEWIKNDNFLDSSRWKNSYHSARASIALYNLIDAENARARKIASAFDERDYERANSNSATPAPISTINELLLTANIPIKILLGEDDQLLAQKEQSHPYSIAELSDGERNAILICADVLTAHSGSLIVLDEPERHLHRSIISPLLSSLFVKRQDCAFAISTHDIHLPNDHENSSVLIVRNCVWHQKSVQYWEVDYIDRTGTIPDDIRLEILGSKRKILFVEGESSSLDKQLYQIIYPSITVISQGSCVQVEKSVEGLRQTEQLHWIEGFGLIDSDNRSETNIESLYERGIVALSSYSVEGLYYRPEMIRHLALKKADLTGENSDEIIENALADIISDASNQKERLCARVSERRVRNVVLGRLPTYRFILDNSLLEIMVDLDSYLAQEIEVFDKFVDDDDISSILSRYPIRETQILTKIARAFDMSRNQYESSVRKALIDSEEMRTMYRDILQPLTDLVSR